MAVDAFRAQRLVEAIKMEIAPSLGKLPFDFNKTIKGHKQLNFVAFAGKSKGCGTAGSARHSFCVLADGHFG